jgi:hypothetical protein
MNDIIPIVIIGALVLTIIYFYDAWNRREMLRQVPGAVEKLLQHVREGKIRPASNKSKYFIAFDSEGFAVKKKDSTDKPLVDVHWSAIERVTAFKRDFLTVDCICLAFECTDERTTEINEEIDGWQEFQTALPTHLPGFKENWFSEVAFPAFATNLTELYRRQPLTS